MRQAAKLCFRIEPPFPHPCLQATLEWLDAEEVLPALLRANLHTRQYADLVGRVLRKLAPNGGVADSDLTFLWDLAQKVQRQLAHTTWQSTSPAVAACPCAASTGHVL